MNLELWVIVAAGSCLTGALAALAVLILGVHADLKRLIRTAEGAQQALAANLRQMSLGATPAPTPAVAPAPAAPAEPVEAAAPPLTRLAEAVAAESEPVSFLPAAAENPSPEDFAEANISATPTESDLLLAGAPELPAWNPDRRLLVTRLLGRGKNAEQIAAALRIPLREVEEFLEANRLMPAKRNS